MKAIPAFFDDVLSRDNTNTIEGFFSLAKRRMPRENPTLLDVFKAIDYTEAVQMARADPAVPTLPAELATFLKRFIRAECSER